MKTRFGKSALKLSTPLVIVGALFLAGCGGSDAPQTEPEPTTPEPTPPAPGHTALQSAVDAHDAAEMASGMAASLLKSATDAAGMLTTKKVNGDSQEAYDNVMIVFGATELIEAERMKAAAAVTTLMGIDRTELSDADKARVDGLLEAAEADLKAIDDILDAEGAGSLMMAVANVRELSEETDEMIAARKAKGVADAVKAALTAALGATPAIPAEADLAAAMPASTDMTATMMRAGKPGRTFKEITGDNVMRVANLAGITATDGTDLTFTATAQNGTQTARYKGIDGDLFCLSAACSVTEGAVTGDLAFVPDRTMAIYAVAASGDVYEAVTNAASYGYWLNADGSAIVRHVRTLTTPGTLTFTSTVGDSTVTSASYSGMAAGYSERTTGTGEDAKLASGEFTASVNLNATFGAAASDAMLGGKIENFAAKEGSAGNGHVDPTWAVYLSDKSDSGTFATVSAFADTETYGPGENGADSGAWTATAYGEVDKQPAGYVGAFNADFSNGSAAGVYQAD